MTVDSDTIDADIVAINKLQAEVRDSRNTIAALQREVERLTRENEIMTPVYEAWAKEQQQ